MPILTPMRSQAHSRGGEAELAGAIVAGSRPVTCPLLSLFLRLRLCCRTQTFHLPPSLDLLSLKRERSEIQHREQWGESLKQGGMPPVLLSAQCFSSPFFSRTIYYTGYRQVYAMEAQTVFRCCPGWSQQPGDQGCLSGECPSPNPASVPPRRPCLKGAPPAQWDAGPISALGGTRHSVGAFQGHAFPPSAPRSLLKWNSKSPRNSEPHRLTWAGAREQGWGCWELPAGGRGLSASARVPGIRRVRGRPWATCCCLWAQLPLRGHVMEHAHPPPAASQPRPCSWVLLISIPKWAQGWALGPWPLWEVVCETVAPVLPPILAPWALVSSFALWRFVAASLRGAL